ncbi:glutathione binding-like protein [Sphingopyxis sp. SE2]|jgi:glutathione S-transferase|uniref:glutathione S-transferase family protein n=1 Tax=unclassified Sphingopyxis TaxID=2614943 RepID=UPI00050D940E|nr:MULTISPECIES: glutathione binding-like protein [unclassified Sphingopyxis]KGB57572.1 Glutathione S-transferase-like protein [Sphingopyxis sp. LC363]MDT7529726.1 glutathione binding-like protein [Sphingopyxis sp. SE2]
MIHLYASEMSGNAHKVRMALAFLGLGWDERATDAAARTTDAFLALNPMAQIPVYVEGDFILRDSQAILAYLAARHRPGDWDGRTPEERGAIMVWLSHAANEIFNGPALLRAERLFGWSVDRGRAAAVTDRILPVVEAHLAGRDWLVGDRLTIADLAASPYLALAPDGGVDLEQWPAIHAWTRRIAALPAFPAMPGWPAEGAA